MSIKLLSIQFDGINIFANNQLKLDFVAENMVREDAIIAHEVNPLFSSIYSLNTVALTGVNASGKASSLKLIEHFLHVYLYLESVNSQLSFGDEEGWISKLFTDTLTVTTYFVTAKTIYCVESHLEVDRDYPQGPAVFTEEVVYTKSITANISKKEVFSKGEEYIRRSENETLKFVPRNISIFNAVLTIDEVNLPQSYVNSLAMRTNYNLAFIDELQSAPLALINYLDSSIEYINIEDDGPEPNKVILKFFNKEAIETRTDRIQSYLSSGTIRGIAIYTKALAGLKTGGYLIIDELENHLNKQLVQGIINHFNSTLNKKGATLIFSTHYIELLDLVPRTDAIYLLTKDQDINLVKLANTAHKRSDIKKSNIILGGDLNTTPSFSAYTRLREEIKTVLREDC